MRIAVAFKTVFDSQDIQIMSNRKLDYSKAKPVISEYDKNAIELGVRLETVDKGEVVGVTVGGKEADNSKLKKDALARGLSSLILAADEALSDLDSRATAGVLAKLVANEGFDLVLCGDGSADNYSQQVDVQLAEYLGWPIVTAAVQVEVCGRTLRAVRALENCTETVEVELPVLVSVMPDVAEPRIPGMKDILAAGKKPIETGEVTARPPSLKTVECLASEQVLRAGEIVNASKAGVIEKLAAIIKAAS